MKPNKPVPTFLARTRNKKRDSAHKLYVDTSRAAKEVFSTADSDELQDMIAADLQILAMPSRPENIEVDTDTLKQMALLANVTLTRMLYERYKNE